MYVLYTILKTLDHQEIVLVNSAIIISYASGLLSNFIWLLGALALLFLYTYLTSNSAKTSLLLIFFSLNTDIFPDVHRGTIDSKILYQLGILFAAKDLKVLMSLL